MKNIKPQDSWMRELTLQSCAVLALAAVLAITGTARATDWTGDTSASWADPLNWSGDTAPTATDEAVINWYGGPPNTPALSSDYTIKGIHVGRWGGAGVLTQTGGTLTNNDWGTIGWGGNGTYHLNGGSYVGLYDFKVSTGNGTGTLNINTTGSLSVTSGNLLVATDSGDNGTVNLYAGTVSARIYMGLVNGAQGTLNIYGGTINAPGDFNPSERGTGVVNQSGGTVNVSGWMSLSRWGGSGSGGNGTYNLTGGTVNVGGNVVGISEGGDNSSATMNVSGGTLNCNDYWVLEDYNGWAGRTATLNISGSGLVNPTWWVWITKNAAGTGVVNLNGGTLAAKHLIKGDGTASLNFNGGTLKAKQDDGNFIEGAVSVNVKAGGAVIDSGGYNITIQNSLLEDSGSTGGGLTKNGNGMLYLTAGNTFTGPVVVNGGTLFAQCGFAGGDRTFSRASSITVKSGATLKAVSNGLFGWDGPQVKPITVEAGGAAFADGGDQVVGLVTLAGGTLANANADAYWGSWCFGRGSDRKLLVTEDSVVTAQRVLLNNGSTIEVASGKTLDFQGTIDGDVWWGGASAVIKDGNGTLRLSGANTYPGNTTINAGTLALTGSGSIANTTNIFVASSATFDVAAVSFTLGASQTLKGNGAVNGTVTVNGTVAPGTSIGTLTFSQSPTLAGTTVMEIDAAGTPNADKLVVTGNPLAYGGTLTVNVAGSAPAGGEVFDLFDASSFSGAFGVMNLPTLADTLNWWSGLLETEGKLVVNRAPTGVADRALTRAKGISMKIKKADLMAGVTDPDLGDTASFDSAALFSGTGTVTTDANYVYYVPADDNGATIQFRVKDTRGGMVTKNINITVSPAAGIARSVTVSGGKATLACAGIPGCAYKVQRSENLTDWEDLPDSFTTAPANGAWQYVDSNPPPTSAYYRTAQQ